ncbi:hypothetical protein XBI1_1940065 [Xenorhabdus bovienii str. Intermedium]|uniref:Uncharacterized protein n=1 Tax=Xenorhabdus bovienii str. Intermedium TaxID=1379677 RepID=A0A077QG95_XENBV|nr:hypothetical protein XBI1_1940065 [Xenorhabdus bovienii str. Intermedium]
MISVTKYKTTIIFILIQIDIIIPVAKNAIWHDLTCSIFLAKLGIH